jgi:hypothetical protein
MTRCGTHAQGGPVEMRPGFENIHIVRQFVRGRTRIVSCRRYDRGTDAFIDIDSASLGIEEE